MKTALIVVNYNSGDLLRRCLNAVQAQTRAPTRIVVVDNASDDNSLAAAQAYGRALRLVRLERNIGFAAANNLGLTYCEDCDWVATLNPDAFPEPDWLSALLRAAADLPESGSLASCLIDASDSSVLDGIGDAYHVSGLVWRIGHGEARPAPGERREVFAACAAAALYRTTVVRAAGGFDESYFCYNEDVDLGFRLRLVGLRCWYVPDAVVHHMGSAITGRHSPFSLFHGHRNLEWTYLKNMPRSLLVRFLWQHLLLNVVTLSVLSVRHRSTAVIRAKFAALKDLRRVLEQRRAIQATRTCDDDELLAAMSRAWWRCYFGRSFVD